MKPPTRKSPLAKRSGKTLSAWELGKDLFGPITDTEPKTDKALHSKRLLREHFRGTGRKKAKGEST